MRRASLCAVGSTKAGRALPRRDVGDGGMAFRLTRDLLAVMVTSAFLLWVVATFFGPLLLHLYVDYRAWGMLFGLDILAAVFCVLVYLLIRTKIPEPTRPQTR